MENMGIELVIGGKSLAASAHTERKHVDKLPARFLLRNRPEEVRVPQ
jgi:hypothetical protein